MLRRTHKQRYRFPPIPHFSLEKPRNGWGTLPRYGGTHLWNQIARISMVLPRALRAAAMPSILVVCRQSISRFTS